MSRRPSGCVSAASGRGACSASGKASGSGVRVPELYMSRGSGARGGPLRLPLDASTVCACW